MKPTALWKHPPSEGLELKLVAGIETDNLEFETDSILSESEDVGCDTDNFPSESDNLTETDSYSNRLESLMYLQTKLTDRWNLI